MNHSQRRTILQWISLICVSQLVLFMAIVPHQVAAQANLSGVGSDPCSVTTASGLTGKMIQNLQGIALPCSQPDNGGVEGIIGKLIGVFLSIFGIVFLILMILFLLDLSPCLLFEMSIMA